MTSTPMMEDEAIFVIPMDLESTLGKIQDESNQENRLPINDHSNGRMECESPVRVTRTSINHPLQYMKGKTMGGLCAVVSPNPEEPSRTIKSDALRQRFNAQQEEISFPGLWLSPNDNDDFSVSSEEAESLNQQDFPMEDPMAFWETSSGDATSSSTSTTPVVIP